MVRDWPLHELEFLVRQSRRGHGVQGVEEGSELMGRLKALGVAGIAIAVAASAIWCGLGWLHPSRLVFLPFGDVIVGFRSYGGWFELVDYAPWTRALDFPLISIPWSVVLFVEVIGLCGLLWCGAGKRHDKGPGQVE